MAYDEGLAEVLRGDLAGFDGIEERRMFGGLAFLRDGHMLCGCFREGGMFRVGKDAAGKALTLPGVREMRLAGRKMGGLVVLDPEAMSDDAVRADLLELSIAFTESLPPK